MALHGKGKGEGGKNEGSAERPMYFIKHPQFFVSYLNKD